MKETINPSLYDEGCSTQCLIPERGSQNPPIESFAGFNNQTPLVNEEIKFQYSPLPTSTED